MQQQTINIPSGDFCKFAWPRVLDQYQYYDEEYELWKVTKKASKEATAALKHDKLGGKLIGSSQYPVQSDE